MQTMAAKHALELQEEFDAMAHLLTEEEKLELQRELLQLHHAMDPDQAAAALAKFDTDGDGKVSSAELRAGLLDLEITKQNAEAEAAGADQQS
jgi:Ca2+-binding EF-hand superfamily protein